MFVTIDDIAVGGRRFDLVVVGTGFGSAFFLAGLLERLPRDARVLVVERGALHPHDWQIAQGRNSAIDPQATYGRDSDKPWNFTIGFGGGTNCWFAQTPRMHPSDFRLRSLYGRGVDWPFPYEALEPYYGAAETLMAISGDAAIDRVTPRSTPFPQPPHRPSAVDRAMMAAQPDRHFVMPTARARVATPQRPACCATFRCGLCPANAKFTVLNGLMAVFSDPRVSVLTNTRALRFETVGGTLRGLVYSDGARERSVEGDLFVLGANAIHSPAILEASGMGGGLTGRGLHESLGAEVEVLLDGLDNFDGSTITTGINYTLADGAFRRERGAALIFFENRWKHGLRREPGRWRQLAPLTVIAEDLVDEESRVTLGPDGEPQVAHPGPSAYAQAGIDAAMASLPAILAPLPVEAIRPRGMRITESHLQGTLRMGADPQTSVIDPDMIHHRFRNLVVVGSAAFPTCSTANPSLTVAALSLRAADRLAGGVR